LSPYLLRARTSDLPAIVGMAIADKIDFLRAGAILPVLIFKVVAMVSRVLWAGSTLLSFNDKSVLPGAV